MIAEDGKQLGVMMLSEALDIASQRDLDLVEVAPHATPPVCRLMDYHKYLYQRKKAQKVPKTGHLKEIRLRLSIHEHDYQVKLQNIKRLLQHNNKVKVRVILRGRELSNKDSARNLLERITCDLADMTRVESGIKEVGNQFVMVLSGR